MQNAANGHTHDAPIASGASNELVPNRAHPREHSDVIGLQGLVLLLDLQQVVAIEPEGLTVDSGHILSVGGGQMEVVAGEIMAER